MAKSRKLARSTKIQTAKMGKRMMTPTQMGKMSKRGVPNKHAQVHRVLSKQGS